MPERMIVAPSVGIFRPVDHDVDGGRVDRGRLSVCSKGPGTRLPSAARSRACWSGMLAHPGERLREGQPIAWLRVA